MTTRKATVSARVTVCIPPIAKYAMDGAPGRYWPVEENKQRQRQKQMRGFFAGAQNDSSFGFWVKGKAKAKATVRDQEKR
jgi:hypothetical protein